MLLPIGNVPQSRPSVAVGRVPKLQRIGAHFQQFLRNKLVEHTQYTREHGDDLPEVKNWQWTY